MRPASVWLAFLAISSLWPLPAAAEVIEPHRIVLSFGVLWFLVGLVLLAIWVAVAAAGRLLRGTKQRPMVPAKSFKVVAGVVGAGWLASVGMAFLLGTGRRVGVGGDARMIGDIRSIVAAQASYANVNGGFYEGDPTCLAEPARCIPGYSRTGEPFLDRQLASREATGKGYRRVFHPGPLVDSQAVPGGRHSRSSVRSYAIVSSPLDPARTGGRGLCGDASGVVCATDDGSAPLVVDGACVVTAKDESSAGKPRPGDCRALAF